MSAKSAISLCVYLKGRL